MEEVRQEVQETQETAVAEALQPIITKSVAFNPVTQKLLKENAKILAAAKNIPLRYQNDPASCFVAYEMALRMDIPVEMVMQNLYVVQGNPAWSGQSCISLINGTRLFAPLDFVYTGTKGHSDYGCYIQTTRRSDGKVITGTVVDMAMAKAEGWLDKKGSKWLTMPEQMLAYRAAAFFARIHCPHALMGLQTVEEVHDIKGYEEPANEKVTIRI